MSANHATPTLSAPAGATAFPDIPHPMPPTNHSDLDRAVSVLASQRQAWIDVSSGQRAELIDALLPLVERAAPAWVQAACRAKDLLPDTHQSGEEWLTGPYITARNLRLLARSLRDIHRSGVPRLPGRPELRNGRVVAPVFPTDAYDRLLFLGYRAEVWMQRQVTLENLPDYMAAAYHDPRPAGRVCLVLAAGNVSSIAPTDVFYKLFVESQVVLLKMNPVNEYLGEHFEQMLAPLIDKGVLRIVYGGREEGKYLCQHPGIDTIHVTGSDKTHDAIVFGDDPQAEQRRRLRQPLLTKPISSELGNVSGVIIVPGQWRPSDIRFQAENLASMLANNAGCNCNATRVIVTHKAWPQRQELLEAICHCLARVPLRKAYYPGARQQFQLFHDVHPDARCCGADTRVDRLPWLFITDVAPDRDHEICFTTEPFCSVMSETALAADSPAEFVRRATGFVNDRLWGTLNASVVVHPRTLREAPIQEAVDNAIADLRVGTVALNHWAGVSYALCSTTWGAFPGHELHDIQSGRGVVHNTYMFDAVEKSVLYGPFRPFPKPPWFVFHRSPHKLGPKLVAFECRPAPWRLPGVFRYALR